MNGPPELDHGAERWCPIVGFEDRYEISDQGRVRSIYIRWKQPRYLKPTLVKGYKRVTLWRNGVGRKRQLHSLVLEAFVGPSPPGQECRHLDGNRTNCALENLRWGTSVENGMDKRRHESAARGERHPQAKLTREQVSEIRDCLVAGNESQRAIAAKFSVTQGVVWKIRHRRGWAWL